MHVSEEIVLHTISCVNGKSFKKKILNFFKSKVLVDLCIICLALKFQTEKKTHRPTKTLL